MFFTRQKLEEIEDKSLAPYGMRSKDTKGRAYLDGEPEFRTPRPFAGSNTRRRSSSTTKATTSAPASPTRSKWLKLAGPWRVPSAGTKTSSKASA
jgi:hypothetical protein